MALKAVAGDQSDGIGPSTLAGVLIEVSWGRTGPSAGLPVEWSDGLTANEEEAICPSKLPICTWDWRQRTSNPGPNYSSPLLSSEDSSRAVESTGGDGCGCVATVTVDSFHGTCAD